MHVETSLYKFGQMLLLVSFQAWSGVFDEISSVDLLPRNSNVWRAQQVADGRGRLYDRVHSTKLSKQEI